MSPSKMRAVAGLVGMAILLISILTLAQISASSNYEIEGVTLPVE